jgi:rhodanese-related sulfurtransferase
VREKSELNGPLGHIEGIVHIPVGSLSGRLGELDEHKSSEIVVICRSGARAHTAGQILNMAGFQGVSVLIGGMIAWNSERRRS